MVKFSLSLYLSVGLLSCVGESQILSFPRKRNANLVNLNGMNSWQWLDKPSHAKVISLWTITCSRFLLLQILTVADNFFVEHKRRLSPGPGNSHDMLPLPKDDWDTKQGVVSEDAEQETSMSWITWLWNNLRVEMKNL